MDQEVVGRKWLPASGEEAPERRPIPPPGAAARNFLKRRCHRGKAFLLIRAMSVKSQLSFASGYLQLGMFREAAAELARLDGQLENDPDVLRLKLEMHAAGGEWRSARKCGRLLVELAPEDAQAWISYAFVTRRAVSIRSARRILARAERLHPEEPIIKFNLSCYASQLGHFQEATLYLIEAIAIHPACQDLALSDPDLEPLRTQADLGLC